MTWILNSSMAFPKIHWRYQFEDPSCRSSQRGNTIKVWTDKQHYHDNIFSARYCGGIRITLPTTISLHSGYTTHNGIIPTLHTWQHSEQWVIPTLHTWHQWTMVLFPHYTHDITVNNGVIPTLHTWHHSEKWCYSNITHMTSQWTMGLLPYCANDITVNHGVIPTLHTWHHSEQISKKIFTIR